MIRLNSQFSNIVESGSNENGHYIKYDNGYMECWHKMNTNLQNTDYHYQYAYWNYPVPFVEIPDVLATPHNWEIYAYFAKTYAATFDGCNVMQQCINPLDNQFVDIVGNEVVLRAIGKWK